MKTPRLMEIIANHLHDRGDFKCKILALLNSFIFQQEFSLLLMLLQNQPTTMQKMEISTTRVFDYFKWSETKA